ncbi:hypothetical protein D3C76_1484980 [compost metagenome]
MRSNDQRRRAEHFFTQVSVGNERCGIGGEQPWRRASAIGLRGEHCCGVSSYRGSCRLEALLHARGEHTVRGNRRNDLGQLGDETLTVG